MSIKKLFVGLVAVAMLVGVTVSAQTTDSQLEAALAELAELRALVASLLGGSTSVSPSGSTVCPYTWTRDLNVGASGNDVMKLQQFLNSKGFTVATTGAGSPGSESSYFGGLTKSAVVRYQNANAAQVLAPVGLTAGSGYFGPSTRSFMNASCVAAPTPGPGPGPGGNDDDDDSFSGDEEGYLDDFERVSTYTGEEVGEGQDDVTVLGVQFEASDAAQKIERVEVRFDHPTDTSNSKKLTKLASEVSLWLDGEELDRMDIEDGSYDRNAGTSSDGLYTFRFTGLDAVVDDGDTARLLVKLSGINNLDSASNADGFDVFIPANGIRAVSPNGVDDTYDSSAHETTFTVETFASATDLELEVNLANDNPEEGIVIVDNDGDSIELARFTIKADGAGMNIYQMPIALTSAAANINAITDELVLEWDGGDASKVVSTAATTGTITFDDLDIEIDEDDTVEFTVIAKSATSTIDGTQGVTLQGQVTVDDIDAEDETGETVADADATGSGIGETQHLFTVAPIIVVNSVDIDPIDNGTAAAEAARATIEFTITARGGTIYLNGDNSSSEEDRFFVGLPYGSGVTNASTTASTTTYTLGGNYTVSGSGGSAEYYTLTENNTMTIEISSVVNQAVDTDTAVLAGLKALLVQFGVGTASEDLRSAININWTDFTDQTQTGTVSLVNPA